MQHDDKHQLDSLSELALREMDRTGWNRFKKLDRRPTLFSQGRHRGLDDLADAFVELNGADPEDSRSEFRAFVMSNLYGLNDEELREVAREFSPEDAILGTERSLPEAMPPFEKLPTAQPEPEIVMIEVAPGQFVNSISAARLGMRPMQACAA